LTDGVKKTRGLNQSYNRFCVTAKRISDYARLATLINHLLHQLDALKMTKTYFTIAVIIFLVSNITGTFSKGILIFSLFIYFLRMSYNMTNLFNMAGPPVITTSLQPRFTGKLGEVIRFICPIRGDPEPIFEWYRVSRFY
jgi:VanZ family protein